VADFFAGKAALIEHDYAAIGPFDGLGYVHRRTIVTDGRSECSEDLGFPGLAQHAAPLQGGAMADAWAIGAQQCRARLLRLASLAGSR
jgi:hypothetical protein